PCSLCNHTPTHSIYTLSLHDALPISFTHASPFLPLTISYGTRPMSFLVKGSSNRRPIRRLMANNVLSGLVTAWRLAGWPIRRSLSLVKATIDGVVRAPSEFSTTLGLPPSITATHELVVPRSIPITLAMVFPTSLSMTDAAHLAFQNRQGRSAARYAGDIGLLALGTREPNS